MGLSVFGLLALFFAALTAGVWIFISRIGVAMVGMLLETSVPIFRLIANQLFNSTTSPELLALPLFILMAEILFRTKVSEALFSGLAPWTIRIPGQLLHVNVMDCTLFAAVCGSSAATTATVGKITLYELGARGYSKRLSMGSLAGAGTLGFLIPPSLIMIIYGVLSQTSILKLFIAGILPGILLACLLMLALMVMAARSPMPKVDEASILTEGWRRKSLQQVGPVILLMGLIIGAMYGGYASPTEASVVGVFGALGISAYQRCLTPSGIGEAALAAARTSSMLGLLLASGSFLSVAMGYLGIPQAVASWIGALELSPMMLIGALFLALIVLGCFLDGTSILIMTLPITVPLIVEAGFDKVWFGVFLVLAIELAQITPPVGFNLFVIQGLTGEPITRVALYALPFFFVIVVLTVLITFVPEIVLFLPSHV
jgi:tripartite ATP-independent transporter DctM subunit